MNSHALRRRSWLIRGAAVGVLLAAGAVAAGVARPDPERPAAAGPDLPAPPPIERLADPGLEHVHGLGVDPADGLLYAATHYGLFRVPAAGPATRVADRFQDTMAFTVAGPRRFLGSGHPDPREGGPPLLGLIESTDAAATWRPLSLRGEVDFHVLRAVHDRIYGYGSQRDATSSSLLVSDDGLTWERRGTPQLRDFAVSPRDPDALLATQSVDLLRSADGGRLWSKVPGAPQLELLSWTPQMLIGVGRDGSVHSSADGGATWTLSGNAGGEPQAVTTDAREGRTVIYVALAGGRIVASTDGGRTFSPRYSP